MNTFGQNSWGLKKSLLEFIALDAIIFFLTQSLFGKFPKMILHKKNYANAWLYEYLSYDELLGHGTWLQSFALVRFPRQGLPPLKGWGSVQVRCRKLVPLSHDLLQMLHGTSSLRPPSTIKLKWSEELVGFFGLKKCPPHFVSTLNSC